MNYNLYAYHFCRRSIVLGCKKRKWVLLNLYEWLEWGEGHTVRAREKVYITGLDVSEKGLTLILLHSDFCIVMCVVNMLINLLLIQSTVLQ